MQDFENLPEVEISYDDNIDESSNQENEQTVSNKYTVVDHLDEDAPIPGQNWVCLSFVSPEGIMNTKIRAVKIRGVFATEGEARNHAEELQKKDKYFDTFVGEVGKFLAWDPDPNTIKDVQYKDKKLNKIMQAQQKKQLEQINELVGRKKEMIDKKEKGHERRVADKIISGSNEEGTSAYKKEKNKEPEKNEQKQTSKSSAQNLEKIRARMRKNLEDRTKSKTDGVKIESELEQKFNEQNNNINERLENINIKKNTKSAVESNIDKIKKYMASKNS